MTTRTTDRNPWLMWLGVAGWMITGIGLALTLSDKPDDQALSVSFLTGGAAVLAVWMSAAAVCWQITQRGEGQTVSSGAARSEPSGSRTPDPHQPA